VRPLQERTEIRGFRALARLMLISRRPLMVAKGRMKMAKIEALSFTVGMMLTALLTLATLAPVA
jgi:hypothetical protein